MLFGINSCNAIASEAQLHQISNNNNNNIVNHTIKNYTALTNFETVNSTMTSYCGSCSNLLIRKLEIPFDGIPVNGIVTNNEDIPATQGNILASSFQTSPKWAGTFLAKSSVIDNNKDTQCLASIITDSLPYKYNKTIAFIEPTFTYAAYQKGSFYDFYDKYQRLTDAVNKTIKTDLDMLKNKPIPHGPFQYFNDPKGYLSIPYIDYFKVLQAHVKLVNPFITKLTDVDVHEGKIFQANGSNAYDVLFMFHNEYVTASEYSNLRRFVSNGGTIVFTDANILFAEVSYNKINDSITLVKGHYWKFVDGEGATRSISERWLDENKEWHGSNFFDVPSNYKVYFRNNPFNYTHSEEQYVTNPHAKILINYETTYSSENHPSPVIATYYMYYGKGMVINLGIWGHTLVNNKAFLKYFDDKIVPLALSSH